MNRLLSYLIIGIFLLSSCVTQRKCLEKFPPTEQRDSVYSEKIDLIPVFIPGFSQKTESKLSNCPDQKVLFTENDKLRQEIEILNGKLISNVTVKGDSVKVPSKKTTSSVKEVKVPQPVKYIPEIYKDAFWICIIEFAIACAWLGMKIYKFFK